MNLEKRRFFIALLPHQTVQGVVNQIKDHFAEVYNSKAAKKSPPHITLQPPFTWPWNDVLLLHQTLETFTTRYTPIPIILNGFGAFKPRVIFIKVEKTSELLQLQEALSHELETTLKIVDEGTKSRPFHPHITVAFRDLQKSTFQLAWQDYQDQPLQFTFTIPQLTLLLHNGQQWEIERGFEFSLIPQSHTQYGYHSPNMRVGNRE